MICSFMYNQEILLIPEMKISGLHYTDPEEQARLNVKLIDLCLIVLGCFPVWHDI